MNGGVLTYSWTYFKTTKGGTAKSIGFMHFRQRRVYVSLRDTRRIANGNFRELCMTRCRVELEKWQQIK